MAEQSEWRLIQGGMVVASGSEVADAWHYAMQYGQDGPVTIQIREPGKRWKSPKLNLPDAQAQK